MVENNHKNEGHLLDFTEEEEWSEFATAGPVHASTGVGNELAFIAPPNATFEKFADFTEYHAPVVGKQTFSNPIDIGSTNVIRTPVPEPLATTEIEVQSFPALISLDAKSLISNEKKAVAGLSLNALRNNQK